MPCESYEKFLEGECFPCKDKSKCGNMGYHSDKSPARGKMYLLTRDEEPFCGKYVNIKISIIGVGERILSCGERRKKSSNTRRSRDARA